MARAISLRHQLDTTDAVLTSAATKSNSAIASEIRSLSESPDQQLALVQPDSGPLPLKRRRECMREVGVLVRIADEDRRLQVHHASR